MLLALSLSQKKSPCLLQINIISLKAFFLQIYRFHQKIKYLTGNHILDHKDGLIATLLLKVLKYSMIKYKKSLAKQDNC